MNDPPPVIFDLDGTLVDSESNHYEAGRRTLADHGIDGYGWAQHAELIGIGTRESLEILRARHRIAAPLEELLAANDRHYAALARRRTLAFPQMRRFAARLAAAGHPLAVASGSSRAAIEAALAGSGLSRLIGTYVSDEEVPAGKPAPDVLLEAARRLGVAPERCTVVEDSAPGAVAAHRAGMRCIALPAGAHAERSGFDTVDLLVRGGQREFRADAAYAWLCAVSRA